MRAVVVSHPGGLDALELRSVPDPVEGPEEIRVRVRAAALNRADLLQRRGLYPAPAGSPAEIPGLEFAGEVESCGPRVTAWRPRDRVMGILGGGAQAERVVVHERLALRVPPSMSYEEAAAIPEAYLTAYDALFRRGRLAPGESVLVHAAASGVGTAVAMLATVAGARVLALSRSAEKRKRLESLGVERVFDPARSDLADAIRMASGGDGVKLVIDFVGAPTWALNVEALGIRGRLVLVGTLGGARTEIDLTPILRKRLQIVGTVLRTRPLEEKIALVQEFADTALPLFASGRLSPVVDRVLDLASVAEAHRVLEQDENFGKVVLRVP